MTSRDLTLRQVHNELDAIQCFPLIQQLRTHLTAENEFVDRWRRQTTAGYRMVALCEGSRPLVLAGFRVQENLVHGRFLYVDDLVTDSGARGCGYGERLMQYLQEQTRLTSCNRLLLDTPMSNCLGHRFYFRCGLLATALRFSLPIAP